MSAAANMYDRENPRPIDMHEHAPEHCRVIDLADIKDGADPKFIAACEEYFSHFVRPVRDKADGPQRCFHCGEYLTGFHSLLLGKGGFEWGIAHGEGHCANCHWPARGHHYDIATFSDGEKFSLRNYVLSYHPDFVERRT